PEWNLNDAPAWTIGPRARLSWHQIMVNARLTRTSAPALGQAKRASGSRTSASGSQGEPRQHLPRAAPEEPSQRQRQVGAVERIDVELGHAFIQQLGN